MDTHFLQHVMPEKEKKSYIFHSGGCKHKTHSKWAYAQPWHESDSMLNHDCLTYDFSSKTLDLLSVTTEEPLRDYKAP